MSQDTHPSSLQQSVFDPPSEAVLSPVDLLDSVAEADSSSSERGFDGAIAPVTAPLWSIESYADNLMDELFGEVDQILDGAVAKPPDSIQPVRPALQAATPVREPGGVMVLSPPSFAIQARDRALNDLVTYSTPYGALAPAIATRGFEKLLLSLACASIVALGWLLFVSQGRLEQVRLLLSGEAPIAAPASPPPDPKTVADTQFANYLQRSLESIPPSTATAPATTPTASPATTTSTTTLPTVAINGNTPGQLPSPASPAGTVLERVYIPVYQPPQMMYAPPAGVPGMPNLPSMPTVPQAIAPQLPPAPGAVPVNPPAANPVAIAPSPAVPTPAHTLVGILELGNRSAALFDINGSTQRVNLGEPIGASGWTLVKVSNQAATLRRNNEVRAIYMGQKF